MAVRDAQEPGEENNARMRQVAPQLETVYE
jgi:hypothetical protein